MEIRVEYSIWRYEYLRRRGQFAGTCCERIHRLDCIVCKHRTEAVLNGEIPAIEGLMISIQPCKLLHHLYLTALDRRVAQVVVLVLRPSRAHEHLHSVLCSSIHDCVHRTLPVCRIVPVHQFGRIVCLFLIGNRHEYQVFHAHILHFGDLHRPHLRVGAVHFGRIGILVPDVLIRKVDECSGDRKCLLLSGWSTA